MIFKDLDQVDYTQIVPLFQTTFTQSDGLQEGQLIAELVKQFLQSTPKEDLRIYFLEENEQLVAGACFTRFWFENNSTKAFLMAPVVVLPPFQRKGLGQKLIHTAHEVLRLGGVQLCISYGDINFYSKVGYKVISEVVIPAPLKLSYPHGWIAYSLEGKDIPTIQGQTYCVQEIRDPRYW